MHKQKMRSRKDQERNTMMRFKQASSSIEITGTEGWWNKKESERRKTWKSKQPKRGEKGKQSPFQV